jgi:hypothetical protein
MIRDLYRTLAEADAKPKEKPKPKIPKEEPFLEVKLVDGKKIRDTVCVDFIGGGHALAYPGIIPKGEIWIEQELAPDEQQDILVHELVEFALMSKADMQYTAAHNFANKIEKVFRGFEGRWKTKQAPTADKADEGGEPKVTESTDACPKCKKPMEDGHICQTKNRHWKAIGGRFVTPAAKKKADPIRESEDDLVAFVTKCASNAHPDNHVISDYEWAMKKDQPVSELVHHMPGGIAGWKSFLADEVSSKPDDYTKLSKTKTITSPVIISPGHIWDGWHRIAAAILNGHRTIPAVVGKLHAR